MLRLATKYHSLPVGVRVGVLVAAGLLLLVSNLVREYSLLASFALATTTALLWLLALLVCVKHRGTDWSRGDLLAAGGIVVALLFIPVATQGGDEDERPSGAGVGATGVRETPAQEITDNADPTESRLVGLTVTQGLTQSELRGYTGYFLGMADTRLFLLQMRGEFQWRASEPTDDLTFDFTFLPPGAGKQFNTKGEVVDCTFSKRLANCVYSVCSCGDLREGDPFMVRALLKDRMGRLLDQAESKSYELQPRSTKPTRLDSVRVVQGARAIRSYVGGLANVGPRERPLLVLPLGSFPPTDSDLGVETTFHDAETGRRLDRWNVSSSTYCDFRVALGTDRETLPCVHVFRSMGGLEPGDAFVVRTRVTAKPPGGTRTLVGRVESRPYVLQAESG